jgi:arylsulfatase A-like enzyme/predicted Zn-dependent protease
MEGLPHRARSLLAALLPLLAAVACTPSIDRVVLISVDTLRADHVGCYGASRAHTPTLDAVARRGVRFDAAVSPAPLTLPSHATLLTGLDPPQHGVRDNSVFSLAEEIPTLAERFREAGFATAAFVGAMVLDRRHGLARGFDVYGDRMGVQRSGKANLPYPERRAEAVVDEALAWMATGPERFFLWVHLYDPHVPYQPPPGFRAAFPDSPYDGEIAYADAQLARLLAALERSGPGDRTLLVVTSDHGESLGEHGFTTHGYSIYEATQRVPLLMRGPGLPAGRVVTEPVGLTDIAPTLLEVAGLDPLATTSGEALDRVIAGDMGGRVAYMETLAPQLQFGWSPLRGVRTRRHRYVRAPRPELYDLGEDPRESRNLAGSLPDLVAELDGALQERLGGERAVEPVALLSEEERARLESLGYAVASVGGDPTRPGAVGGRDPKDRARALRAYFTAKSLLAAGRPQEALALLDADADEGAPFRALRADLLYELGDYPAAETEVRRSMALDPTPGAHAHAQLARALLGQGRRAEARVEMERALARQPDSADLLLAMGRLEEQTGDLPAAETYYQRAVETREGSLNALLVLAAFRLRQGRTAEADALLALVPEDADPDPDTVAQLARAEAAAGRQGSALQRIDRARRSSPGSAPLAHVRGALLQETRPGPEALAATEEALRLDPGSPLAQNNLAWALLEAGGDLDRALRLSLRAHAALPESPAVLDTLATIRVRRGESAEALGVGALGVEISESRYAARFHAIRARAHAQLGHTAEARTELRTALSSLDPTSPAIWIEDAAALAEQLGLDLPARLAHPTQTRPGPQ